MPSRQLRLSHDPPGATTRIRAHPRPRRAATVPPHRGHRTRSSHDWYTEPGAVAASLRGRQDLRHSFASRALALGESLPMIGKLLGNTQVQTTARYAHIARNSVKVAAVRIADSPEADMDTPPEVSAAL